MRRAIDATRVVDLGKEQLIGHPNNYWPVVARCEQVREQLGILDDRRILELAVRKSHEVACANPCAFMDDHADGNGRYDIYTFHSILSAHPLFPFWPKADVDRLMASHADLFLSASHPVSPVVCWGRSLGASGPRHTLEVAVALIENGHPGRERLLGLAAVAAGQALKVWWRDDAVASHRCGMSHWYLGPFRLMEGSLGFLTNLARPRSLSGVTGARNQGPLPTDAREGKSDVIRRRVAAGGSASRSTEPRNTRCRQADCRPAVPRYR